jgi:polyketide synthase PksN
MWKLINQYDWTSANRYIKAISTGEALPSDLARDILAKNSVLWNLYGPTETTIWATGKKITSDSDFAGAGSHVAIGRPFENYTVAVLDNFSNPVPLGVPGELHIGGAGLARRYLDPAIPMDEKFISYTCGDACVNLYKTGDLVRVLADHDIDYLGRIDNQVKINGYRIEPGEIEAALKTHASVQDAAVKPVPGAPTGTAVLVAYIIPRPGAYNKNSESFNRYLARTLPHYMLPRQYLFVDEFPLNANGKVDRNSLPMPRASTGSEIVIEPRDALERTIAEIFCDVLGLAEISIYDNFFDVGGSSILAAALLIPLQRRLNVSITLKQLLMTPPTVSNVAALIRRNPCSD